MSNSIFKVYKGNYLADYGIPTVIITADQVSKEILYSEYFVFIEGKNILFWDDKISIDTNNSPEHIIRSIISTTMEETLLKAETTISIRQHELFKKQNIELRLRENIELREVENHIIFRLWSSGKFEKQLISIQEKSICEPLKDYLKPFKRR